MKYELVIKKHNIKPHLDIEEDIRKKDGLFTFNLMVSQGNIESYATYETIKGGNPGSVVQATITQSRFTRSY